MRISKPIFLFIEIIVIVLMGSSSATGTIIYQNFEKKNGTPQKYGSASNSPPEYGWAFGDAVAQLSTEDDPVYKGEFSWVVHIPKSKPVSFGTGIPSQTQTYNMNFVPNCHNRFQFWVWSSPSEKGNHTVMVKFFDHGVYSEKGIGVWSTDKSIYQEWSKVSISFDQLPADFDLTNVDKVEIFHYWDGTYIYDELMVASDFSNSIDQRCMQKEHLMVCDPMDETKCISSRSKKGAVVLDYLRIRNNDLVGR